MNKRIPPIEKRFKKGVSGNPHGRPRILERDIFEIIIELLKLFLRFRNKDRAVADKLLKIKEILNEE
jgi:hypothetical protein